MQKLRTNIIGAGAMGHLWASYLISQDSPLRFYTKKSQVPRLLELKSAQFNRSLDFRYCTFGDWQDCDLILICVKAHQLAPACQELVNIKAKKCPIILMMNGMGLTDICAKILPGWPVYHAYVTHGVYLEDKQIIHAGLGICQIGDGNQLPPVNLESVIGLLNSALPPVNWNPSHQAQMNLKLIVNAIINPLTALSGKTNGSILKSNKLTPEAQTLFDEISLLFPMLLPGLTKDAIQEKIEQVADLTKNNRSSMLQDVLRDAETEIDFINGYLNQLARQNRISLKLNTALINKIKALGPVKVTSQ